MSDNASLQLNRVESEGGDYEKVLLDIKEKAKRAKCEGWLNNVIRQLYSDANMDQEEFIPLSIYILQINGFPIFLHRF